jgi:hypothetical protein
LIGVVGLTVELCSWGTPGIYASVSTHLEWIYDVIGERTTIPTDDTTVPTLPTDGTTVTTTTTEVPDSAPSNNKIGKFLLFLTVIFCGLITFYLNES